MPINYVLCYTHVPVVFTLCSLPCTIVHIICLQVQKRMYVYVCTYVYVYLCIICVHMTYVRMYICLVSLYREVQLPLQTAPVGKVMEAATSMVHPLPHDKRGLHLENIIYQASYTDASRRPSPVVPKSHCWTPNGSIYCGCQDGQLFLVDSESGSATVLLSPLSANDRTRILLSEAEGLLGGDRNPMRLGGVGVDANVMGIVEEEPSQEDLGPNNRPAHEVLRAGDVDCIALNRKGLYVAGKVCMYCT